MNPSIWVKSLLVRVLSYSVFTSVLVTIIFGSYWWFDNPRGLISRDANVRELAAIASLVFWLTFLFVGGILWALKKTAASNPPAPK